MTTRPRRGPPNTAERREQDEWIEAVADAAAKACHAPVELLGEYLTMLADAAIYGRRPGASQLAAVRELGQRAAEQGVGTGQAVELYLSAAWRLWRELPVVVRSRDREHVRAAAEAVLRVVDDAVGVFVESHQAARREMIRQEESLRREFIDDLLRGDANVSRLVERAEPFGLDLGRSHRVALAPPGESHADVKGRRSFSNARWSSTLAIVRCWSRPRTAWSSSSFPALSTRRGVEQLTSRPSCRPSWAA